MGCGESESIPHHKHRDQMRERGGPEGTAPSDYACLHDTFGFQFANIPLGFCRQTQTYRAQMQAGAAPKEPPHLALGSCLKDSAALLRRKIHVLRPLS